MPNKLIHETSPYLLQHANNPVDWYAWGNEALKKAIDEDKPILLSIGYSACHWCHVMEHESFENEETAAIMNEHFINIKVDREERPDIDHIYMDAVQAMTGSGGWPLNVFLTPDKKPFYGGTYFPPVSMYNRSSWKDVLLGVSRAFKERRKEIEEQAENLTAHLQSSNIIGTKKNDEGNFFSEQTIQIIAEKLLSNADMEWGGFAAAPKFPQTMAISFLMQHYHFTRHKPSLDSALLSLDKMYMGGLYDHAGGGFARYSTDARWHAPHFEKMLYDNALLLGVYAEAYKLTQEKRYEKIIKQTILFLEHEMKDEHGAFYAALDADSEGVEGKFYTWNKSEIDEILKDDAEIFSEIFDITEKGNWEHTNILWLQKPINEIAVKLNMDADDLQSKIDICLSLLLQKRNERIRPGLDDKILLGWNALLAKTFCKCAAALGDDTYIENARKIIGFIETKMKYEDGSFAHSYKEKKSNQKAFLDDYASLAEAYLYLQQVTGDEIYFAKAEAIAAYVLKNFDDETSPLLFYTQANQEDVIVRKKELYDGATPSGNAQMIFVLQYLSIGLDKPTYSSRAGEMLEIMRKFIEQYPSSFCYYAQQIYAVVKGINEIGIGGSDDYKKQLELILKAYIPFKIIQPNIRGESKYPKFESEISAINKPLYYLCRKNTCFMPVTNVNELLELAV